MLDHFKSIITNQYHAALSTLNACVDRCPESAWNAPVANLAFCQVAFHALFFTDLYLDQNEAALRDQPFHRENEPAFRDYEELQDRRQQFLYDRPFIKAYVDHCRAKVSEVVAAETEGTLAANAEFAWLKLSRAELHVYNIRHIQHHAAQLILRLRLDGREHFPWFSSGWREV